MNISQMMRSFLGEASSSDSRQVELKAGQVVRGVVLQTMENSEALVQIGGLQVRAKLETPMQAGQSAMLQVQPQTNGAVISLKQVDPGSVGLPDDTFKEWAKQLALPEQKWAVEIVKDLRKDGLILNRDIAQSFQQAAAAMPAGADVEQWMQAASAAFRRGLPMTAATIGSMQQVMSGPPAHVLLGQLQQQLAALAGADGANSQEGLPESLKQAVTRLQGLLSDGETLLRAATGSQAGEEPATGAKSGAEQGAASVKPALEQATTLAKTVAEQTAPTASTKTAGETGAARAGGNAGAVPSADGTDLKTELGAGGAGAAAKAGTESAGNGATGRAMTGPTAQQASSGAHLAAAAPEDTQLDDKSVSTREVTTTGGATESERSDPAPARPNWLGQMMKWLGVDHELQLTKLLQEGGTQQQTGTAPAANGAETAEQQTAAQTRQGATGNASTQAAPQSQGAEATRAGAAGAQNTAADPNAARPIEQRGTADRQAAITAVQLAATAEVQTPAAAETRSPQESLKSALFSLIGAEGTPPAIKETAQQLIQQISGQQLMLTPERNSSMLTHVTMFIPLRNQDGSQTASVHIQTRRGRKGELDASNCRLLFQLSMKTIGETMVDVNVMDKVVSLNLWNDHPSMAHLAEAARSEVASSLQSVGYQLLSLRTTPLPKPGQLEEERAEGKRMQTPPDLAGFSSTRYKGVDFRI